MTDWEAEHKRRHEYIAAAPEHARGYYLGMIKALFYAQAQVRVPRWSKDTQHLKRGGPITIDMPVDDAGYGYSPSGLQKHAAHFYDPEPEPAPDRVDHNFDPVLFDCLARELDSEGGIMAWHIHLEEKGDGNDRMWSTVYISVASTEDDFGVPDDWPVMTWDTLCTMRDRIAALGQ